jgi:hypothetical protein
MKEEIIKNVLIASLSKSMQDADVMHASLVSKRDNSREQLKHVSDIVKQISAAMGSILERAARVPEGSRAAFLESEIKTVDQRLQALPQQIVAEINKLTGSIEALEYHSTVLKGVPGAFDVELSRAKEVQEMQQSGALKEKRKPGERPLRVKDVRNYAPEDSNSEKE